RHGHLSVSQPAQFAGALQDLFSLLGQGIPLPLSLDPIGDANQATHAQPIELVVELIAVDSDRPRVGRRNPWARGRSRTLAENRLGGIRGKFYHSRWSLDLRF